MAYNGSKHDNILQLKDYNESKHKFGVVVLGKDVFPFIILCNEISIFNCISLCYCKYFRIVILILSICNVANLYKRS